MIPHFNNPFRYAPHPLVIQAAEEVTARVDSICQNASTDEEKAIAKGFQEGKMLGVLVCTPVISHPSTFVISSERSESRYLTLAAFSGTIGPHSTIEGFVPPIYDLLTPDGHFKTKEAEITRLNKEIAELQSSEEYTRLKEQLTSAEQQRDNEIQSMRTHMAAAKKERDQRRSEGCNPEVLIKESQHEKAELRRLRLHHESKLQEIKDNILSIKALIDEKKLLRAAMSDELQEWIFKQYKVHNALGESSTIYDIFSAQGLTPPGGTGDCAAPKLLEYAYRNELKPLAMGEFWYGTSPDTAVRTHGHFYPSCTSKCGPLLGYMLRGIDLKEPSEIHGTPEIIYKDDALLAVSKPSGMPSVPGLDGRLSVQEWLEGEVYAVHRLDMDTSGVLLFAKTEEAAQHLRKQFETHTISKTYLARLSAPSPLPTSLRRAKRRGNLPTSRISLPLSPDYDERPRQKVDLRQSKEAITDYEVLSVNPDSTIDIAFHPVTGRTHQLRVHSAHHLGLSCPILGDLLYGGHQPLATHGHKKAAPETPARLHLHALSITFTHPTTGLSTTIESELNIY